MKHRVLLLGSGAREHAMAQALAASSSCAQLFVAPGNAGTPGHRLAVDPCDTAAIVALCAREHIDLVVVGPEGPLAAGVVDALQAAGVAAFGPTQNVAQLESSKVFAREMADQLGIPAPRYATFARGELAAAQSWLQSFDAPVVVKQSGLAAGKGVVVANSRDEALAALERLIAIDDVVVEERLTGVEC